MLLLCHVIIACCLEVPLNTTGQNLGRVWYHGNDET